MKLNELAAEYRYSGSLCRERALEIETSLKKRIRSGEISALHTMRERKRILELRSMARDCAATASYLENYYSRMLSFERCI